MSQLEVARNIKKYHAEENEKEIERQREFSEKLESELNDTKTKFKTVNDELERKLIHSKNENKKQAKLITTLHLEIDKYKQLIKENEIKEEKKRQAYKDSITQYENELEAEKITEKELIKENRIQTDEIVTLNSEIIKCKESGLKEAIKNQNYQETISKSKDELQLNLIDLEKVKGTLTNVQKENEMKSDEIEFIYFERDNYKQKYKDSIEREKTFVQLQQEISVKYISDIQLRIKELKDASLAKKILQGEIKEKEETYELKIKEIQKENQQDLQTQYTIYEILVLSFNRKRLQKKDEILESTMNGVSNVKKTIETLEQACEDAKTK